jgi:hypothetical protein
MSSKTGPPLLTSNWAPLATTIILRNLLVTKYSLIATLSQRWEGLKMRIHAYMH